ncbi:hypothetical protein C8R44DRAFT_872036 [Mycena epipterygia]|nr:hypothetical protein C8R44DRAFT_872036 [Mycena epipterygia]
MAESDIPSLHSLPTEILAEILLQSQTASLLPERPGPTPPIEGVPRAAPRTIHTMNSSEVRARPKPRPPPLPLEIVVSHVSRRFREVAVSTPQLWTSIQTRVNRKLIPAQLFEKCLQRSEPYLISVTLSTWRQADDLEAHSIHLISHIDRLRELRVQSISRPIMVASLLPFRDAYAPRLELLRISDDWNDRDTPTIQMEYFDIFMAGYPCLHTLQLHLFGTHLYVPKSPVSVTTLDLTHTSSCRVTFFDLRELLTGLSNLTHLSVSNELLERQTMGHPILLPSVRSFSTSIRKGWISPPVWPLLNMSGVESVTLNGAHNNQLKAFFDNLHISLHYPALRSFSLVAPPDRFSPADANMCIELSELVLQVLSSVTHLTLRNVFFPDIVLQKILTTGDRALPSLLLVDVYSHQPGEIENIRDIFDTVTRRVAGGGSIKLCLHDE